MMVTQNCERKLDFLIHIWYLTLMSHRVSEAQLGTTTYDPSTIPVPFVPQSFDDLKDTNKTTPEHHVGDISKPFYKYQDHNQKLFPPCIITNKYIKVTLCVIYQCHG